MNVTKGLLIVTAHGELGSTGQKTGVWFEELSTPYYVFADNGMELTIATLPGGEIPVDPKSLENEFQPTMDRFFDDPRAMDQLRDSQNLGSLDPEGYHLIFLPGGHGAMWDLGSSRDLGMFLSAAWNKGAVIATVCHGPAGLVHALEPDGSALVKGKKVTGFSNSEERLNKLTGVVPFLLEDALRELGADYQSGEDFEPFTQRDGRLVTGQNPASSEATALLALKACQDSFS